MFVKPLKNSQDRKRSFSRLIVVVKLTYIWFANIMDTTAKQKVDKYKHFDT